MATSFVDLAKEVIAQLAADTDAETQLTFETTVKTRANPWEAPTSSAATNQTITGFLFPPGTRRWNGELLDSETRVAYVAAADLTSVDLNLATTVQAAGEIFPIASFNKIPEGDNPALYEVFLGLN